ncbi:hypothetical protein [Streptomyces jeddahensis]|uniref:Uncharacterized protein n=1 Tax=Streptomyces jeddahensis TaxID=1716141 RepID=A0A177HIZ8_9ACTN|nr:hypothetical protein [Streptomyces jeddahensis]OAH10570.1 hypothetical protein STSP_60980 [Streptomyces jeddahensis]
MGGWFLFHYYEHECGPFRNLSDLTQEEAEAVQRRLRERGDVFASRRSGDYLTIRRQLEEKARELFIRKGGKPTRARPHYMTLGACEWIRQWYRDGRELRLSIDEFDLRTISFTYGDLFPTMRYDDGRPYRGEVYTWDEMSQVIDRYGLPQDWNPDGSRGPERYIEAQIWDDAPLARASAGARVAHLQ